MCVFSIPQDYILQQHGLCLLPVQLAVFDGDFASGNQWLQQHNQTWEAFIFENNKKLLVMFEAPFTSKSTWWMMMHRNDQKCLRIIQVWTGNNLQWLQGAPVIHMKKEIFLLGSNRANPSLKQNKAEEKEIFEHELCGYIQCSPCPYWQQEIKVN